MAPGKQSEMTVSEIRTGRLAWLALMLTPGMGPKRIWKSMERLASAERLFEASLTELEGLGMPAAVGAVCFEGKAREAAEDEMKRVMEAGGRF